MPPVEVFILVLSAHRNNFPCKQPWWVRGWVGSHPISGGLTPTTVGVYPQHKAAPSSPSLDGCVILWYGFLCCPNDLRYFFICSILHSIPSLGHSFRVVFFWRHRLLIVSHMHHCCVLGAFLLFSNGNASLHNSVSRCFHQAPPEGSH